MIYALRDGLRAISPAGALLWVSQWGDLLAPPPVVANGKVYVGSASLIVAVKESDHALL